MEFSLLFLQNAMVGIPQWRTHASSLMGGPNPEAETTAPQLWMVALPPLLLHGQTQGVSSIVGDSHTKRVTPHAAFMLPSVGHHTWSIHDVLKGLEVRWLMWTPRTLLLHLPHP